MEKYIFGGAVGCALGIGIVSVYDLYFIKAYTFRDDRDNNGQEELYLNMVDSNKTYLIQEDNRGNITGISELEGLELKLGEKSLSR